MANEITIDFGTLNLDSTNNIAIGKIQVKESKPVKVHKIPKSNGSIAETAKRESLMISVTGDIAGSNYDDLRTNLDALKAGLQNGLQKFTLDDDRYIMGQLKTFTVEFLTLRTLAQWKATFIAHYPYWLSESLNSDSRTPSTGVSYEITNAGNAPTRAKIVITAPGGGISDDVQIENLTTGELCKYRGDVAAAEDLEVDNRVDTDDFEVLNDGDSDMPNFEGDFITLNPGVNDIELTGTMGVTVLSHRDAWY